MLFRKGWHIRVPSDTFSVGPECGMVSNRGSGMGDIRLVFAGSMDRPGGMSVRVDYVSADAVMTGVPPQPFTFKLKDLDYASVRWYMDMPDAFPTAVAERGRSARRHHAMV